MDVTREDVDLMVEYIDLKEAFLAAKERREEDPEGYASAKQAFSAHRTYWRQIREYIGNPDGTENQAETATATGITSSGAPVRDGRATPKGAI